MQTTEIGRKGEAAVCRWLVDHGYRIIQQNYCIRGGEIDIIAENGEYLAFVEVKTRRPNGLGTGYDAVHARKQARLIQAAAIWCEQHPMALQPRFDVACVTMQRGVVLAVEYLPNAFDATGSEFIF